jgi:hypothetical protein
MNNYKYDSVEILGQKFTEQNSGISHNAIQSYSDKNG